VRDLSRTLGKEVELVIEGEDTEVDKHVVDALADPLVHILRNSLDHGIETPEERLQRGKNPRGRICIRASQEGDRARIQIEDDGRGMDPQILKRKAYEKKLISEETLESLDDEKAMQLVFLPGFSTSETVTDVSGRGVGMDVVRRSLERIGGTVALSSRPGVGTCITLLLPLSMAVSRVLGIELNGQPFGIPLEDVLETVRVPSRHIHHIRDRKAMVLRGQVIPLYSAAALLDLNATATDEQDEMLVLVARCASSTVGLIVDGLTQAMEVIVKPLDGPLAQLSGYVGAALLGDGTVLPVLNLKELL
jgi:two-component system chemotaxis sensor kinase CheA